MRVLVLNYEYPPLGGGAGVATAELARGLAEWGVTVDVVTAAALGAPKSILGVQAGGEEGGLNLYRVPTRRKGLHHAGTLDAGSYLVAALPLVQQLLRTHRYDAVHFFFSLPTGAMLPFLQLGDVPVVVSLRGSDVPGYDPYNRGLQALHRVLRPLTRWIWRRADQVVALSEGLGGLARETLPDLRYTVIHNGVDVQRFRPSGRPRPPRFEHVRCVAVARLIERKGLIDLLQALALLERGRYELEVVGSGPDEALLRALADRLELGSAVHFTGALDRDGVAHRLRMADLFTLASWEESFGNVFAEALASGLPIVGTNVGGIPEFIEHGRNGLLVPPRNPLALSAAIRRLADDPARRREIAVRNRLKAERELSWSSVAEQYLQVYRAVQRGRASAPVLVELPTGTI